MENWKERRALARPYFLRSTTRLSRVRKPPFLSTTRSSGSKWVSAVLKKGGFLTRDSRVVERKKYGRAKARRSFQFSKR